MKKILLTLLFSITVMTLSAQDEFKGIYDGIENAKNVLNLSGDQISKIKRINREYADKFRAIGKDRSLIGYAKGQRKKALALEKQQQIDKILNQNQINIWKEKYGNSDLKDTIEDKYEDKLNKLEDKYDKLIDDIEDNDRLSKEQKKAQTKELKRKYKAEKEKLKQEREKSESYYGY